MSLPLFDAPKEIYPAFAAEAEIVLFQGDVNDFVDSLPDGSVKLIITSLPYNEGIINVGVEIVPLKELANEMSTGVSYFEQIVWDLEHRGVADIDIPVLILGIAP